MAAGYLSIFGVYRGTIAMKIAKFSRENNFLVLQVVFSEPKIYSEGSNSKNCNHTTDIQRNSMHLL